MCFKITSALREYYRYSGVSAEIERLGYGSYRPELAWANRQKQRENEHQLENQASLQIERAAVDKCYRVLRQLRSGRSTIA